MAVASGSAAVWIRPLRRRVSVTGPSQPRSVADGLIRRIVAPLTLGVICHSKPVSMTPESTSVRTRS